MSMMNDDTCKLACGYFVSVEELIQVLQELPYSHVSCEKLYDIIEEMIQEVEIQIDGGETDGGSDSVDYLGNGLWGGSNVLKLVTENWLKGDNDAETEE